MQQVLGQRTPMHFWIIGILSLLWNAFGGYDYLMSRTHNDAYLKSMMPGVDPGTIWSYMDSMPLWASFGWGLGVWASLLGSVLLLMRSRHATPAFAASLVGVVLSFSYQLFLSTNRPPSMDSPIMATVIFIVVAVQLYYAMTMRARGILR